MVTTRTFSVVSPADALLEPYPYVYVNEDSSIRELHSSEKQFLQTPFMGSDGARPYVKPDYQSCNGWGSIAGFCPRSGIPGHLPISAAPLADPNPPRGKADQIAWLKSKMTGFEMIEKPDGTISVVRQAKTD